jgi:hypothetical protein
MLVAGESRVTVLWTAKFVPFKRRGCWAVRLAACCTEGAGLRSWMAGSSQARALLVSDL